MIIYIMLPPLAFSASLIYPLHACTTYRVQHTTPAWHADIANVAVAIDATTACCKWPQAAAFKGPKSDRGSSSSRTRNRTKPENV